jgi:superfamily II DNA or RNA helicase
LIYVDTEQNVIGHVETESPMELARGWISAPVIEPEYHESVVEILREQKLPPPPPLPEPEKIDATLRPIIRLCSGLRYGATSHTTPTVINPEDHTHWAEVRFRYGPVLISPHHSDNTIERKIDGKRYRIRRDQAGEKSRMTEIERAGLTYSYYSVPRSGGGPAWIYSERFCENWESWINKGIPILEASGWTIEFDPSCILQRADVHDWFMDIADADQAGHDWFNIDLGIVIDGERVSLLPLLRKILADPHLPTKGKGANAGMRVSLPDHRCIKIPMKRLEKIRELLIELYSINPNSSGPLRVDRLRAAQFAGVDGWRWNGSERVCDLAKKLAQPQMTPVAPPDGLNATLRPYQLDGLTWLQFLREYDLAGVLADDMGLGKTIQTLAHLLTEKRADRLDQPALVVAPTSLMGNWRDETRRFAPDLRLLVLHGSERHEHFEKLADFDLIVTSYQLLARDQEFLMRQPYHTLILDEAQMIKNPSTLYAQAARKLTCRRRLALTGTPMENRLGELWAIFDFLMPGFLGNHTQFRTLFRDPIEKGNDLTRRQILAKRIAPLILRRRKSEVALELPPKNEMIQSIEISGAQRDLYESIRVSMESRVREQIADMGLARSHIVILDALLKLRQVCCDPRLLKIPGAQEIKESAKLEWLVQALPSMVEEGRKILLFSQFTSMLDLIEEKLNELNIRFVRLTGDTRDRDTPVKSFQNGDVPLFMISLKAGGTGLNLTAADTVIHYDPWWNPAVENQATDRAHRIGQDKTVFVYKLITQGTVEEKIHALQERKAQLLAGLLDESGQSTLKLGEDELRALFAPLS